MATITAENDSLDEDSRTNFVTNLLLLQELHGILGFAVSKAGLDGLKVFICAELATLGLKLARIPPALYQLEGLSPEVLETYSDHLSSTLTVLNNMVTENLAMTLEKESAAESNALQRQSSWPDLIVLHDIIAARYKTAPELTQSKSLVSTSFSFSDERLLSYLVFSMSIDEQNELLEGLSSLNHDIEEILTAMPPKASKGLKEPSLSEEEDDFVLIKQAQDYRQQISDLYKTLARNMCSCQRGHVAQLGLSSLGVDKDTLDIYISICCGAEESANSESVAWHLTKCSKKDQLTASTIEGSLCQFLNEARERRLPAMLIYSGETISEHITETHRLPSEDLLWSFIDLATVLDEKPEGNPPDFKINATDRLRLQCLLTQSLLFLHPSSWMPETLKLSNIHFTAQKTECDLKKPYMYCAFQKVPEEHGPVDTDAAADFMIHFALLLLQIEVGRPLMLLTEEERSKYGHELALDRYVKQFSENLNVHITQVLMYCLWFKKCLGKASHPKMSLDLKIRYVVSQHIFKPLVRCLEFNYPTVAREILSYSMEQRQEAKVIATESTPFTQKRKIGVTDQRFPKLGQNETDTVLSEKPNQIDHFAKRVMLGEDTVGMLVKHFPLNSSANAFTNNSQESHFFRHTCSKQLGSFSSRSLMPAPPAFCDSRTARMSPESFTIGWISAIPLEKAVACAMLDEEYPKEKWPFVDTTTDNNSYTFGRLHGHNVVIACLPKGRYGNTSAAVVARDMRASFSIKFGLLVGIAGGAPSRSHDIRLGDVVVGTPTPGYSGVLQYDYGKAISQREFKQTGHMAPPPENVLTTLANLEAHHKFQGHHISQTVGEMLARNTRLKRECSRPSGVRDRLFRTSFKHCNQCPCETPDNRTLEASAGSITNEYSGSATRSSKEPNLTIQVPRPERTADEDEVNIHYGLIASANKLMKDADARDKLIENSDVLCFEMEAAGIVNSFPCVIIRGICDYSDSHKNDMWQGYAAANAAAYAKELLEVIPHHFIKDMKSSQ